MWCYNISKFEWRNEYYVKSFEESDLLTKISETIKNEAKEQKWGFLEMSLDTSVASLLGHLFTGKGTVREGEGTIIAGQDFLLRLII